jgi:hypothetical protein
MRLPLALLAILGAVALCIAVYLLSGGRFLFVFLPLLFGAPLLFRRPR